MQTHSGGVIVYRCPHCGEHMSSPAEMVELVVACFRCDGTLRVPPARAMVPPMNPYTTAPSRMREARCSRVTYILLAFFLGFLGVHNFVAGRIGPGVAQLAIGLSCLGLIFCTFGLSSFGLVALGVWTLVEIATVTTDGDGMAMQ